MIEPVYRLSSMHWNNIWNHHLERKLPQPMRQKHRPRSQNISPPDDDASMTIICRLPSFVDLLQRQKSLMDTLICATTTRVDYYCRHTYTVTQAYANMHTFRPTA